MHLKGVALSTASMDDIDYLLKNSEKDSSMIVIDSSKRDRHKYPLPVEYVLEFSEPFRFVFGFDIIDATIPSTMYSIDNHNNMLCFGIFTHINSTNLYKTVSQIASRCVDFNQVYKRNSEKEAHYVFCPETPTALSLGGGDCYLVTPGQVVQRISRSSMDSIVLRSEHVAVVHSIKYEIEIGNYNIVTLQSYLKKGLRQYNMDVRSTSINGGVDKQMKFRFVNYDPIEDVTLPFFFDMNISTCRDVIGYDQLPSDSDIDIYSSSLVLDDEHRVFASVLNDEENVNQVVSPGVVNLLGVRYVVLRCPEIESHLLGSLGFTSHNTGLGIFKLQSPYEVANLKFDFFNFVKKPFHPIGKLNKLSIRFERDDGTPYDFRGVNHQILVTIKYYVPSMSVMRQPAPSVLNPNYHPNYLKVLVEREEILNDDEDDDDEYEDDDEEDMLKRYVYNV